MNKDGIFSKFESIKTLSSAVKITDTCYKLDNDVFILAYSPTYEMINVNKVDYSCRNFEYHHHSTAYCDNLRNITNKFDKLISPEIEVDRRNGANIDSITIYSNWVEVTNDSSVFKELNVLPIILDDKRIFNAIMTDYKRLFNDLEKVQFTGSKRTGMHFHLSQGLCPNMTETARFLSSLTKEQILLYFGRKLNYGYDTQSALYSFYSKKFALLGSQLRELEDAGFNQKQLDKILNALNVANFKSCRNHTDVLHFSDFNTWEFRACKGTTNYTTFVERLKIVMEIFQKQRVPKKVNEFKSVKAMAEALALTEENNR
jgi:hypothetical protein